MANSTATTISAPVHLNSTGCVIKYTEGKGRGVFASRPISAQTVIEVSPVLLFSAEEYDVHGKYTVLDNYTFKWRDGRMALALGLGSLFNHNQTPNVSFSLDPYTESIKYTTTRVILPDEELCIFYGHKLWFEDVNAVLDSSMIVEADDTWGGLGAVAGPDTTGEDSEEEDGDPNVPVAEDDLPVIRVRITPDELEEEDMESIRTVKAWAVDIADPKYTTNMLKWLKTSGYDSPALSHLKRIRKSPTHLTLLITHSPDAPLLPTDVPVSKAYHISVPRTAAITQTSLALKNTLWPTVFAPRRKDVPETWSRAKVRWAKRAISHVAREARKAGEAGELPIAAHVPSPFEGDEGADPSLPSFTAVDTRKSASHPLRHAFMAVIRQVGDFRATALPSRTDSRFEPSPDPSRAETPSTTDKNGQHYLLTSLTLFTTHEPCIMCSMALLHSRVKEVFYLFPMGATGGCGGAACLPKLEGVNHRFGIGRWKERSLGDVIHVDEGCDA